VVTERKNYFSKATWYAIKFEFLRTFDMRYPNNKKLNLVAASPSSGISNLQEISDNICAVNNEDEN
jgi:hypothetical protein